MRDMYEFLAATFYRITTASLPKSLSHDGIFELAH